ncbi:MAG: flagellar basal body L-ring protein FlgH [Candidatus Auribacterota bacterium]|jgi:flagellar L-ring protein precursor FlgH|nr:flagellar basal body L-ring protein FlgH [Candidatus Auribacterota bacterium]
MKITVLYIMLFMTVSGVCYADSLWRKEYHSRGSLYTDDKASHIGDIVTIIISETTSAKSSSKTTTNKDVANVGAITSWFYPSNPPEYIEKDNEMPSWNYKINKDFSGGGEITEGGSFTAKITARVMDVLPNDNLLIQGSREVTVAGERKRIVISGTVRRSDILPDNTIPSNLIADAKIYYDGKGPIADNQKRGFFTWLRDSFSLF